MKHLGTKPIETERLRLRRLREDDAETVYATWGSDPDVSRWMRWTTHKNVEESREFVCEQVKNYQRDDWYVWGIELKESGRLIGTIGAFVGREEGPDAFEPGYNIGKAFWGKGYTTEALRAVLAFLEKDMGVRHFVCLHATENPASGRVLEKVGFVYRHDTTYQKFDGTEVPAKFYTLDVDVPAGIEK